MLKKVLNFILDIFIVVFQPYVEIINDLTGFFINKNKTENTQKILILKKVKDRIVKIQKVQISVYYVCFVLLQILMLFSLSSGKIIYIEFEFLWTITLLSILFVVAFVVVVLPNLENYKIKFVTYVQILLCFPIVVAYWIVSLEGKDLLLNELNRTDWISLFEIIMAYFSASFIGVVIGYNEIRKSSNKNKKISK